MHIYLDYCGLQNQTDFRRILNLGSVVKLQQYLWENKFKINRNNFFSRRESIDLIENSQ
jgi:hypothetical protein